MLQRMKRTHYEWSGGDMHIISINEWRGGVKYSLVSGLQVYKISYYGIITQRKRAV